MTISEIRVMHLIAKRERYIGLRDGFKLASDNARKIVDTYKDLSFEQKRYYEEDYYQGLAIAKNYQEKIDAVEQKLLKLGYDVNTFDCLEDENTPRI